MTAALNSFQKWACDYGHAHGFTVTPFANWVSLYREETGHRECMSAAGVQAACEEWRSREKHGITLARNPDRPWSPKEDENQ